MYTCPEYAYVCMKQAHAYKPRNSFLETAIKITILTNYHAPNTKTKQPKLTKTNKNERDKVRPLPQTPKLL